jgi:hypothetical protein
MTTNFYSVIKKGTENVAVVSFTDKHQAELHCNLLNNHESTGYIVVPSELTLFMPVINRG